MKKLGITIGACAFLMVASLAYARGRGTWRQSF